MKRFRFRLQSLLELGRRRREMAAREFSQAQAKLTGLESELAQTQQIRAAEGRELTQNGARALVHTLQQLDRRLDALDQHVRRLHVNRRAQRAQVERQRNDFLEKRRDEEKLARLRERRHEAWRILRQRDEQAELDETASQRADRSGKAT